MMEGSLRDNFHQDQCSEENNFSTKKEFLPKDCCCSTLILQGNLGNPLSLEFFQIGCYMQYPQLLGILNHSNDGEAPLKADFSQGKVFEEILFLVWTRELYQKGDSLKDLSLATLALDHQYLTG